MPTSSTNSAIIPPPPGPTSPPPPGVVLPTVLPYTTGTSSPMQSSYQAGVNASSLQNERNNMLSGGRIYKKNKRGGTTSYTVPQFNMLYNPSTGPGQTPNQIIQSSVGTIGQNTANAQYDSCIGQPAGCQGQLGGTKVCLSSQTNCWGCYSGGKKRSIKKRSIKKRRNNKRR